MSRCSVPAALVVLSGLLAACSDSDVTPTSPSPAPIAGPHFSESLLAFEGELFGNVYEGLGAERDRCTATDLYFDLEPDDPVTEAYLDNTLFARTQWVDPEAPRFSIEYYNPQHDGGCPNSYVSYLSGDSAAWPANIPEVHRPSLGVEASGLETHCIIPGTYRARLRRGESEILREFIIDYLPFRRAPGGLPPIAEAPDGTDMWIESPVFDPEVDTIWTDIAMNLHIGVPSGSYSDTPILEIERVGTNLFKTTFSPDPTPAGSISDWFRFRTDRSTSTWEEPLVRGTGLLAIWWNGPNPAKRSGYFEHSGTALLRVHRYLEDPDLTPPTDVVVGLELMRPDEQPASAPAVTRTISIVGNPVPTACFDPEPYGTSTFRSTDQFLDAGCSTGTSLRYQWDLGTGYGPLGTDTIVEFFGHATSGTKQVRLRVKDVAYSPATEDSTTRTITVASSVLGVSGPTYVTDKSLKTYTATLSAGWYERYEPETNREWHQTSTPATTYNRIWPAGQYTMGLRAQKPVLSPLGRGRNDVEVCHISIPGCGQVEAGVVTSGASGPSLEAQALADWGVFGAGPWVALGEGLVRFYDLTGAHEPTGPFAGAGWIETRSGTARDVQGLVEVEWKMADSPHPDIRVLDLEVRPLAEGPYGFGMAVDPDLGASPADDRSGFDPARGLAYAYDDRSAVGFLLLREGEARMATVEVYGARRMAPRAVLDAESALGSGERTVAQDADDVQFLIGGDEASGTHTWRFVLVRGASVREIQRLVDGFPGR